MRLLVFLALMSLCQCFHPPLETKNEMYGLPPQYMIGKDVYVKPMGLTAPVSYANPFLQFQYPYIPISYGYPQYYNVIDQYGSLAQPSIPLPNEISISNNNGAFVPNAYVLPPVLASQRNVFEGLIPILDDGRGSIDNFNVNKPGIPITLAARKGARNEGNRYITSILSINKEIPEIRNIGQAGTYSDLIHQILKGKPSGPVVSISQQKLPHSYINLDKSTVSKDFGQKQPVFSLNYGDSRMKKMPPFHNLNIMESGYPNVKIDKDAEEILSYVVGVMLSEKHTSTSVIQVLNSAKNINFSKLDEIDVAQFIKLNNQDIQDLKQYVVRIINAFGLTRYTLKLLEYMYLIKGAPKSEIHLILKILANNGAPQNFNSSELQQLKRHLIRIYEDFNESPYILAFLKYILETQFRPTENISDIDYGENDIRNENQEIINYMIGIMISENNISPEIIKVLNSVQNIDFSTLEKLYRTSLVQMSNEDVKRLKKYLVQVINLYGLTTYTFKLLEYIFLLEGRPTIETYLMSLIVADNTAVKNFNANELKLVKEHMLQIYTDYNESPYILAFLKNILDNQLKPIENNNSPITDSNDMQEIYLHLSQTYNDNPNVLKILKIINDIHGYVESVVPLPVIDQSNLQSLTTLRPDDLNLLVKYILEIISQRGGNIYLNGLLSYITWIQKSKRDPTDVSTKSEEKVDLSPIYQYLLESISPKSNEEIFVILNHLSQNKNFRFPVTTMSSIETLGYGDLIKIKEFLLNYESNKLNPAMMNLIDKLNQAIQKQEVKVILDGDRNLVDIIPDDLEHLKQYMISKQTAVPDYYLNEILQVIKQAQNQKGDNGVGMLKYFDLMQIYKYLLQTKDDDINNPVFINVQQYVHENSKDITVQKDTNYKKPGVNIVETNNIYNGNQINLEEFYKFLLSKSLKDESNPLLLQLLKYFNQTLILPNGELKIKIISTNSTKPLEQISRQDLVKLLPYLINLKENSGTANNYLYTELLKYLKNKNDYEATTNPLSVIPIDALYRINQYLQTFIKRYGENDHVYQIILQIKEILKSKKNESNFQVNKDLNVNKDDLNVLLQYLTKYINVSGTNSDIFKVIEYIKKTGNDMKYQGDYEKNQNYVTLYLLQLINKDEITPVVKDLLEFIVTDEKYENPNLLIKQLQKSHKLDQLKISEIIELIKYLQQIKSMLGANQSLGLLIDNIIRLENEFELNKNRITMPKDIQIPGNVKENEKDIKSNDYFTLYLLQLLNNEDITPVVKDLLQFIMVDKRYGDPNRLIMQLKKTHKLDKLNTSEIIELIKYLQQIKTMPGANQSFGLLIDNIIRLQNEIELNKNHSTMPDAENKEDLKISSENVKIINKHLINLFDQYGKDKNVVNVIDKINHIKGGSYENIDLPKLLLSINTKAITLNVNDLRSIIRDLINLIDRHGMSQDLMKMLGVILNINTPLIKGNQVTVLGVNDTHVEVTIDQNNLERIQRYYSMIAKYYKLHPDKLNILPIVYPTKNNLSGQEWNNTKPYNTFILKIKYEEIETLTKYVLELIKSHGMLPELINVLLFVCDIYGDDKVAMVTVNNKTKPNDIIIPDDMKVLLQQGVEQIIQNMNPVDLKKLYMELIHKLFASPYNWDTTNMSQVVGTLHNMYNREVNPLNKYILLKVLNYLKNNKDINYEVLRQPDFVLLLLDLINTTSTVPPNKMDNIPNGHGQYVVIQPYDYKNDIEGALGKLIKKLYQPDIANEKNRKTITTYNINNGEDINNGIRELARSGHEIENIYKPFDRNEKNIVANYTIYEVKKDGSHEQIQPNINIEEMYKPININEQNKNMGNYTVYEINEDGIHEDTIPHGKLDEIHKPINIHERNGNIESNYTIYKFGEDGSRMQIQPNIEIGEMHNPINSNKVYQIKEDGYLRKTQSKVNENSGNEILGRTLHNIEEEEMHKPINTTERNKNTVANYTTYQASENGSHGQTQLNNKVEKVNKSIDKDEKHKNVVASLKIDKNNENEIRGRISPNIEVKQIHKPNNTNRQNKNIMTNYTIYKVGKDESHRQTQPNIKVDKIYQPINTDAKNKNVVTRIHSIGDDGINGQIRPNIEKKYQPIDTSEKNKTIATKIYKISHDGVDEQIQPYIKMEKNYQPVDTNEKNKTIVTKIYTMSEDGINGQLHPKPKLEKNVQPLDTNEKNKTIVTKIYSISNNGIDRQIRPNIQVEKKYQPIDTNEKNKTIVIKTYTISDSGVDRLTQPESKSEKYVQPFDNIGKNNTVVKNTNYEINKDKNSRQIKPNPKEVACREANTKFNLILTEIHEASSSNEDKIDLSMEEFLQMYDIFDKFKKRLSLKSNNKIVTSSVLIGELEQRLLNKNEGTCKYQPNIIVKTLVSDLISALRQVIQYMKNNEYKDERMKAIIVSLVNRLMPDINAIAVKDCEARTNKELMSILFTNIYSSKNLEQGELQFSAGHTLHGGNDEDFLQTLSVQKLLQEIAKYKKSL